MNNSLEFMLVVYKNRDDETHQMVYIDASINDVLEFSKHTPNIDRLLLITYITDDGVPYVVWRDGELVDYVMNFEK